MMKKSWKQKVRTGGVRRKMLKQYLQLIKPNTEEFEEQSVVTSSKLKTSTTIPSVTNNLRNDGSAQKSENSDKDSEELFSVLDKNCSSDDSEHELYNIDFYKRSTFREKIRIWAVENNISHIALNKLAVIINEINPQLLPNDSRTILCTPRNITIKRVEGGEYWHNGIEKPLTKLLRNWIDVPDTISLNINMDGLPIFKSSTKEFWPILCNIFENPSLRPFVIGIYFGTGKPKKLNEYLEDFINDMNIILEKGLYIQQSEKIIKIKLRCFICDSPARAFIKGICNFNGKHGCNKCSTIGEYSHTTHTVTFPDTKCHERTNDGFRNKLYGAHHKCNSPLLSLPIDMIKQFVVGDSLHLIDLGLMKRLLVGWRDGTFGKYVTKWRASDISIISNFLNRCRLPSEVHRTVRDLNSLVHWKGTEFRSFLYYLSIVILPDVMNSDAYSHFLMLYCGITICSNEMYRMLLPLAKELLICFVEKYKDFYGSGYITSNVHNLVHLTDEVEMLGPLQTFNAYPFENKLFMIKRMLRTGKNPLSQVAKRLAEDIDDIDCTKYNNNDYPFVTNTKKIIILNFKNFKLSTKKKDSYFLTKSNVVAEINCITAESNLVSIKCYKVDNTEDVFIHPIKSSHLAIYKSKNQSNCDRTLVYLDPKEIKCKLVCIEHKEFQYFIPLLHTL